VCRQVASRLILGRLQRDLLLPYQPVNQAPSLVDFVPGHPRQVGHDPSELLDQVREYCGELLQVLDRQGEGLMEAGLLGLGLFQGGCPPRWPSVRWDSDDRLFVGDAARR
jgi:hypothetical protein